MHEAQRRGHPFGLRQTEAQASPRVLRAGRGDKSRLSFLGWGMGAGQRAAFPPELIRGK